MINSRKQLAIKEKQKISAIVDNVYEMIDYWFEKNKGDGFVQGLGMRLEMKDSKVYKLELFVNQEETKE